MAIPNSNQMPRAEPDEMHHLIVARNIAEYGLYASGHPDSGFVPFDQYDSVGPPVLLPVAAMFRLSGSHVYTARLVMALYFVCLCIAGYALLRPVFGSIEAVAGVLFMACAPMSPYLSRALYGEAPAFLFLLLALWCWRNTLQSKAVTWGLAAGIAFGLAILSKTFMLLALWPLLGTLLADRLSVRTIRVSHVLWPAFGCFGILAAWSLYEASQAHDVSKSTAQTFAEYQHNLLFGLNSVPITLAWWIKQPLMTAAVVLGLAWTAEHLLQRKYDPPLIVLLLFAVFVAFWWIFFTTGHIPRYVWYSCAAAALFTGPLLVWLIRQVSAQHRIVGVACVALIVVPALWRTGLEEWRFIRGATMEDTYQLARYVESLPVDTAIATGYWPLPRSLNFFAQRHVLLAKPDTRWDILILHTTAQNTVARPDTKPMAFGEYEVFTK